MGTDKRPKCPRCGEAMEDLGNLSGVVMTSMPPCWWNTYACHTCFTKHERIESGSTLPPPPDVSDYEPVDPIPNGN